MSTEPIDVEYTVKPQAQEVLMQAVHDATDEPIDHDAVTREKIALDRVRRNVRVALQHAVERGKLRPYEALEAAEQFGIQLEEWVQRQHDHYSKNNGSPS